MKLHFIWYCHKNKEKYNKLLRKQNLQILCSEPSKIVSVCKQVDLDDDRLPREIKKKWQWDQLIKSIKIIINILNV